MANGARSAHALLWGVSAVALSVCGIAESAAQALIANIRRHREGKPVEGLVSRELGY